MLDLVAAGPAQNVELKRGVPTQCHRQLDQGFLFATAAYQEIWGTREGKENGKIQCFDVSFLSLASSFFASYTAMVLPVDPHRVHMTTLFPCATNLTLSDCELSPQAEGQCWHVR